MKLHKIADARHGYIFLYLAQIKPSLVKRFSVHSKDPVTYLLSNLKSTNWILSPLCKALFYRSL